MTQLDEQPLEKTGNLRQLKHSIKHYFIELPTCLGYKCEYLICSCGYVRRLGYYASLVTTQHQINLHKLAVLESLLPMELPFTYER